MKVVVVVVRMDSNLLTFLDNSMAECLDSMGRWVVAAVV